MDRETVFSEDPSAMASKWARAGAELIHVIDLDGAFAKHPQNMHAIEKIGTNIIKNPVLRIVIHFLFYC